MKIIRMNNLEEIKTIDYMGMYAKVCKHKDHEKDLLSNLKSTKLGRSHFEVIVEVENGLSLLTRDFKNEGIIKTIPYHEIAKNHSIVILNEDDYYKLRDDR